jgi:molybdopterin synthase sulfur carrier subunit
MIVRIASPLRSYTGSKSSVEAIGASVADVLAALDNSYPGIRFRIIDEHGRIRRHIKLFLNTELITDLAQAVTDNDTVHIIAALSGG